MASTITTTVTARIPNEDAAAFREQSARFGLRPSKAIATLVRGALLGERQHAEPEKSALAGR